MPASTPPPSTPCASTPAIGAAALVERARAHRANLRVRQNGSICISLDETTTRADVELLWRIFGADDATLPSIDALDAGAPSLIPAELARTSAFMTHPVFNTHHSEHELLRYLRTLADKDLAMDRTMIPLGSCTMKLNATAEMIPITWPEFGNIHPFAPAAQTQGYKELIAGLEAMLVEAPATTRSACSPTPARRANTPACWRSAPTTPRAARATATSA